MRKLVGEMTHIVGEVSHIVGEMTHIVGEMKQNCWGNEAKLLGKWHTLLGKWSNMCWGSAPNTKWNYPYSTHTHTHNILDKRAGWTTKITNMQNRWALTSSWRPFGPAWLRRSRPSAAQAVWRCIRYSWRRKKFTNLLWPFWHQQWADLWYLSWTKRGIIDPRLGSRDIAIGIFCDKEELSILVVGCDINNF